MVFAVVWRDDYLHPPSRVSSIPQGRLLALEIHSTCRGAARDAPPSGAKPDSISIRLQQNQLHISNFDEDEHLELFFNSFVRSASHHLTASSSSRAPSDSCPKFEYRNLATGRPMLFSLFHKIHQCGFNRAWIEPSNCRIHMVCIASQLKDCSLASVKHSQPKLGTHRHLATQQHSSNLALNSR